MSIANVYGYMGEACNQKVVKSVATSIPVISSIGEYAYERDIHTIYVKNNFNRDKLFVSGDKFSIEILGDYIEDELELIEDSSTNHNLEQKGLISSINTKCANWKPDVLKFCFEYEIKKSKVVTNILSKAYRLIVFSDPTNIKIHPKVNSVKSVLNIDGVYIEESTTESNIKALNFVLQKGTYAELDLDFVQDDLFIDSVIGLPDGFEFKNNKVKGTPLKSGEFVIYINLSDGNSIVCNITVPNLIRLL